MKLVATLFDTGSTELTQEDAISAFKGGKGLLWIHLEAHDPTESERFLREELGFHPLEVEDALSPHERPSLRVDGETLFLVASGVAHSNSKDHYEEVGIFAGPHYVVTVVRDPYPLLSSWHDRCRLQPKAAGAGAGHLLHAILDEIVDAYFPALDRIGDQVDEFEESVFEGKDADIKDALALKRRLLAMRQRLAPLRDILNGLLRRDVPLFDAEGRIYLQDVYDHALRLTEVIDTERDVLSAVLDAHLSVTSNNLNEVMKRMTVFSTLLMTAALIAGIYGMNFKYMPELDQKWGYPFSFVLMALLMLAELAWFRWKKWL